MAWKMIVALVSVLCISLGCVRFGEDWAHESFREELARVILRAPDCCSSVMVAEGDDKRFCVAIRNDEISDWEVKWVDCAILDRKPIVNTEGYAVLNCSSGRVFSMQNKTSLQLDEDQFVDVHNGTVDIDALFLKYDKCELVLVGGRKKAWAFCRRNGAMSDIGPHGYAMTLIISARVIDTIP